MRARRGGEVAVAELTSVSVPGRSFDAWRGVARDLLARDVRPEHVSWRDANGAQTDLLATESNPARSGTRDRSNISERLHEAGSDSAARPRTVPASFVRLAHSVLCHASPERWDALYRILFRLTHGESALLEVATDPDVHRAMMMDRAIRRETHKMHAFVRFRSVGEAYAAWFEPVHHVVQRASPLFMRRFPSMQWSILTPLECAHWDGTALSFTEGVTRDHAPSEDELEDLWRSYYAHIFNPARVSVSAMQAEMPRKYWHNLPEARLISELTRDAPGRVARMLSQLDEPAEPIPADLQSPGVVGAVPDRGRTRAALAPAPESNVLDVPGAWDPVHDPGAAAARARSGSALAAVAGIDASTGARGASDIAVGASSFSVHEVPVLVGTASWTDPTILARGVFYPDTASTPEARLRYYASRFPLVEVDATYYAMPSRATAAAWASRSPDGFVFDIKAFALMTGHAAETKRLPDWLRRQLPPSLAGATRVYAKDLPVPLVDEVWTRFMSALAPLRDANKLGPVLLQFPAWFEPSRANADVLRAARQRLGDAAAAVEFRNPAWMTGRVMVRTCALLEQLRFTYVVVDAPPGTASSMPPVAAVTTPGLAMMRLHGRRVDTWEARNDVVSERYRYLYDADELVETAVRVRDIAGQLSRQLSKSPASFPDIAYATQGVHVVYNNCHANYGTTNADEITALLIGFEQDRR
ncbi:MAG TPA: TIGR03915 family putative DNA repair protein [Gemmatimonas sp.]|nr:TIGR03915 family putative DNA repair protein [Gemmatimonas sp.]